MKKNFLYGVIASVSMVSAGAYADPVADASASALTTKGYVNDGLKYVYDIATGTSNGAVKDLQNALSDGNGGLVDVSDLQDAIGTAGVGENPGTGLTGRVETVEETTNGLVQQVNALEAASQLYNAGAGVTVTSGGQGNPATIGLDLGTTTANTTYVFKTDANGDGSWQALEVEDSWNPDFLTNP